MKLTKGRIVTAIIGVVLIALIAFVVWAINPSRANAGREQTARIDSRVIIRETSETITIMPSTDQTGPGLLLYPGAHVEAAAYITPYIELARSSNISLVIVKPFLNLALFDIRDAERYKRAAPGATSWYVAGHSLGGVKACDVMGHHYDRYRGLILLGSYCQGDIVTTRVLSIAGSNDGLSTPEKINKNKSKLPNTTTFREIKGMNHAQFGDYGIQSGDNESTISNEKAWKQLDDAIKTFIVQP